MGKRIGNSLALLMLSFAISMGANSSFAEGGGEGAAGGAEAGGASPTEGACNTPEGARMCAANEGFTKEATETKTMADAIMTAAQAATSAGATVPNMAMIQKLQKAAASYASGYSGCVTTQNLASKLCLEKTSPDLQEKISAINMMMSGMSGMAVNDSCSMMSKIMDLAKAGMSAYSLACSAARGTCEYKCNSVKNDLMALFSNNSQSLGECIPPPGPVPNPAAVHACAALKEKAASGGEKIHSIAEQDNSDKNNKSTALKVKACTYAYAANLAGAAAGIMSLANSMGQSSKCDKNSKGNPNSGPQNLAELTAQCKDASMKNTPECLCLDNPRLPGCANTLEKAGQSLTGGLNPTAVPLTSSAAQGDINGLDLSGNSLRDPAGRPDGGGGPGGAGAPTGGGGGGGLSGGGGGFGGSGPPGAAAGEKKGLNANIFGGAGGGGGGGSWGSGGSSGEEKGGMRSYLPGGDKDPMKLSGQSQNWTKEVTGQGGKSNFEKVRDRYRDNTTTLLNQ